MSAADLVRLLLYNAIEHEHEHEHDIIIELQGLLQ